VLGPSERASEIEAPILALQAGLDQNITEVENDAFEAALSAARVEHEIVVYEGAPHSFFDRKQEEFAEASAAAGSRTVAFIDHHTRGPTGGATAKP
jgi:carboxymethylenebutenolidase